MKKNIYRSVIILLLLLFLNINLYSEQLELFTTRGKYKNSADFVNSLFEPYGVGTGGVLTVFASTIESVFWNPAGLSEISSPQINLGASQLSFKRYFTYFTFATPFSEDKAWALTLVNSYNDKIASYSDDDEFLGNIKYMGNMAFFTFSQPISIMKFGFNLKVINEMLDKENAFGGALDFGLKITPPFPVQIGFFIKNVPGIMKYKGIDSLYLIDNVISVGLGYSSLDGDTTIGLNIYKEAGNDDIYVNLGGEFALNNFLRIRFGFLKGKFSIGTELYFYFLRINYTFYNDYFLDTEKNSHLISMIWYF